jgi:hypothetical protein
MDQALIGLEGLQNLSPGANALASLGSWGQVLTSDLYGKFGELTRRGLVYTGITAAAASILTTATTGNNPAIWNPASSGKLVVPLRVLMSLGGIGTPILQGFTANVVTNAGDNIGTTAPVVTWTNIAPVNCLIGKGAAATTKFSGAVSTFAAAPTKIMDLGFGHLLEGAAATGQLYSEFYYDFDGCPMLPPGTVMSICSTIATSMTFWVTIMFAELPMPMVLN